MARPERIEYEGAYYHVMNRGRGRQRVFHGEKYYDSFLECLELAHKRFALEIHAYCLMGNHYHLLVRSPRGNLGQSMRHINGVYTQQYNKLKRTDGPLFQGRYKAINIEAASYLLEVSRYIHRNPIETKKPLVSKLEHYRWSSYPAYRNQIDSPEWLYKESVFDELGSGQPTASYKRFVEQGLDEETEKFYVKDQWPAARGSKRFVEKATLNSQNRSKAVTHVREIVGPEEVLAMVAWHYDCDVAELTRTTRGKGGKNVGRWMAMGLCQDYSGMKLSELATLFGVSNDSTISVTVGRLKKAMAGDRQMLELYNSICKDLTP